MIDVIYNYIFYTNTHLSIKKYLRSPFLLFSNMLARTLPNKLSYQNKQLCRSWNRRVFPPSSKCKVRTINTLVVVGLVCGAICAPAVTAVVFSYFFHYFIRVATWTAALRAHQSSAPNDPLLSLLLRPGKIHATLNATSRPDSNSASNRKHLLCSFLPFWNAYSLLKNSFTQKYFKNIWNKCFPTFAIKSTQLFNNSFTQKYFKNIWNKCFITFAIKSTHTK